MSKILPKILPKVLVADDDRLIRMTLETGLTLNGFQVSLARSGREAIATARAQNFDAVVSDIYMPDGDGLEVSRELRASQPSLPIILMTAQGELDVTVQALAVGANDIIAKPFEIAGLVSVLQKHLDANREKTAAQDSTPETDFSHSGLIGRSAAMVAVYKLIAYAARTDVTVMITGESGTGKELVARAIHQFSARKGKPFIAVNCSGLTDTLLEAELFGHTKGAFTGANSDRAGFFEAADGGTLFLDELASTSQAFQASLLRVLQSGEVRRVGATSTRRVDVRVIGASNLPLRELAEQGGFRPDLFYRLSVLTIDLPPLRDRTGDIELLAQHLLRRNCLGDQPPILSQEAAEALLAYRFPGNVRELENALKRAAALSSNGVITLDCLPPHIVKDFNDPITNSMTESSLRNLASDWPSLEELERRYLQIVLEKVHGNRQHAAELLGTARRTVQRLIARYGLGTDEESGEESHNDVQED
ncbi:MAG: sigma-54-dependent Fis family transcriptional regulator [Acidobacteria bacterium]|nr:sigma-54-dependent Fis family transcriptional regulator [Acidobacteriota bacterium]